MSFELNPAETAVLVIDFQERLCAAMPPKVVERHAKNVTHLTTIAARLDLPVIVTEQYPRGLGHTIDVVREALPEGVTPIEKTMFSALREPAASEALRATGRKSVVVVGMETHICVYQTVRDLVSAGYSVQVPLDAVVSRAEANWRTGLELARGCGAVVTNTEAVLFDLLKEGRGDVFKEVSRLIR